MSNSNCVDATQFQATHVEATQFQESKAASSKMLAGAYDPEVSLKLSQAEPKSSEDLQNAIYEGLNDNIYGSSANAGGLGIENPEGSKDAPDGVSKDDVGGLGEETGRGNKPPEGVTEGKESEGGNGSLMGLEKPDAPGGLGQYAPRGLKGVMGKEGDGGGGKK